MSVPTRSAQVLQERLRAPALAAAIAAAALLAHHPALRGQFVFDDHHLVEAGEAPIQGSLADAWVAGDAPDYLPITWSVLWVEWRLFGLDPKGYHVVNLLLHAAAAVLLWRVLRALEVPGAWLAGLLFAVHPVTVESVAWISEHKNTVSAVPFFAGALAWIHLDTGGRRRWAAAALALHAIAVLAKPSAVMLPVALLAVPLLRRGRLARRDLSRLAPLLGMSLAGGLVAVWFQRTHAMAGMAVAPRGLAERLGGAGWAEASYLLDAFLPVRLAFLAAPWPVDAGSPLFFAPAAALVALAAFLGWTRARPALLALGYHLALTLPVLGLLDIAWFAFAPVSNHLQYLALAGPVALAAAGIESLRRAHGAPGWALAVAVPLSLGVATHGRAGAFEDDLTLWSAAVRAAPASPIARYELALALLGQGRQAEAVGQLEAMAAAAHTPHLRHRARALVALFSGRPTEAADEALRARALLRDEGFDAAVARELSRQGAPGEAARVLAPGSPPPR